MWRPRLYGARGRWPSGPKPEDQGPIVPAGSRGVEDGSHDLGTHRRRHDGGGSKEGVPTNDRTAHGRRVARSGVVGGRAGAVSLRAAGTGDGKRGVRADDRSVYRDAGRGRQHGGPAAERRRDLSRDPRRHSLRPEHDHVRAVLLWAGRDAGADRGGPDRALPGRGTGAHPARRLRGLRYAGGVSGNHDRSGL